jgi:hypothetical protein
LNGTSLTLVFKLDRMIDIYVPALQLLPDSAEGRKNHQHITFPTVWQKRKVPVRLTLKTSFHSWRVISSALFSTGLIPALLTGMSIRGKTFSVFSTAFSISSGFPMSAERGKAFLPRPSISFAILSRADRFRLTKTMSAPAWATPIANCF